MLVMLCVLRTQIKLILRINFNLKNRFSRVVYIRFILVP